MVLYFNFRETPPLAQYYNRTGCMYRYRLPGQAMQGEGSTAQGDTILYFTVLYILSFRSVYYVFFRRAGSLFDPHSYFIPRNPSPLHIVNFPCDQDSANRCS